MKPDASLANLTETERTGLVWPLTDTLRMEAAMVLWEAVIEALEWEAVIHRRAPGDGASLTEVRDVVGTVELRHRVMPFVEALHIGWHVHVMAAGADRLDPFDWEFTPWFLSSCVIAEGDDRRLSLQPDWLERCRRVYSHAIDA